MQVGLQEHFFLTLMHFEYHMHIWVFLKCCPFTPCTPFPGGGLLDRLHFRPPMPTRAMWWSSQPLGLPCGTPGSDSH